MAPSRRNVAAASRNRKLMCDSVWVMNLDAGQRSANATSTQHRHVYTALCSRKGRHRTRGGVVLSNLNRFSKFSHSETQPLISDLQSKPELTKPRPRTWPKVAWAEACLHTKWHLDASCRLATIKMGRKFGGFCPLFWEGAGSPSNSKFHGLRRTSIPSGILMHPIPGRGAVV